MESNEVLIGQTTSSTPNTPTLVHLAKSNEVLIGQSTSSTPNTPTLDAKSNPDTVPVVSSQPEPFVGFSHPNTQNQATSIVGQPPVYVQQPLPSGQHQPVYGQQPPVSGQQPLLYGQQPPVYEQSNLQNEPNVVTVQPTAYEKPYQNEDEPPKKPKKKRRYERQTYSNSTGQSDSVYLCVLWNCHSQSYHHDTGDGGQCCDNVMDCYDGYCCLCNNCLDSEDCCDLSRHCCDILFCRAPCTSICDCDCGDGGLCCDCDGDICCDGGGELCNCNLCGCNNCLNIGGDCCADCNVDCGGCCDCGDCGDCGDCDCSD